MKQRIWVVALVLFISWILIDLVAPQQADFRHFDPKAVAQLDSDMWRSYYERRPVRLFWQSAKLLREQLHAPFWRSFLISFYAAKAAFTFKDGRDRAACNRALPTLETFYAAIARLSTVPLDVPKMAHNELEWWIIRRDRQHHTPTEWATLQAQLAADLYQLPVRSCLTYGQLRTQAMLFRDQRGQAITENDWQHIQAQLGQSWQSLSDAINQTSTR